MNYIKVIITDPVKNVNLPIFLIPKHGEFDEKGIPIFNENKIRELPVFRSFSKKSKSEYLHLKYSILTTNFDTKPKSWVDFKALEIDSAFTIISENEYMFHKIKPLEFYHADKKEPLPENVKLGIYAAIAVIFLLAMYLFYSVSEYQKMLEIEKVNQEISQAESEITVSEIV
jgi:hypothetical protein